jgi:hypothetical protein
VNRDQQKIHKIAEAINKLTDTGARTEIDNGHVKILLEQAGRILDKAWAAASGETRDDEDRDGVFGVEYVVRDKEMRKRKTYIDTSDGQTIERWLATGTPTGRKRTVKG